MKRICITLLLVSFLFCAQASATLYVKDLQLGLGMSQWYTASQQKFQFIDLMDGDAVVPIATGMGVINTWEPTLYDYRITDATFTMTPCTLITDNNPGGTLADGTFTGSADITVVGSIQMVDGVGAPVGAPLFTGTILTATMGNATWDLVERAIPAESVRGSQPFTVTGGELATGTVSGIKMLDSDSVFTLDLNMTAITDFSSGDYISFMPQIQFVAPVPEPATMLLLLAGGMLVRRKRH